MRENNMVVTVLVFQSPAGTKVPTMERVVYGQTAYDRVKEEMKELGWKVKEEFGCAVEFR